ncbi:hypothetical protein BU25DRAFT_458305 [Macroventuria anomochaeta]|uniref:Uncharacterized protein n=1 Tax=Macroventuria anomochaeta TaxID=301207 RepID=A0ACB6S1R7_9PLEO|nr:uncharacterized protein BU25DRAFT_458305 [Macroventuria anomochaeta]KAF2627917.1 hypothetical protein BU25DRAFT_458305 [Macroventuria anomochaeta]
MPKAPQRRLRRYFETPPRELVPLEEEKPAQLHTPQHSAVIAILYFCQQQKIPCKLEEIEEVFGYPTSTSSDVAASGRCRRLQNHNTEPDTCGALRQLKNSDVNAIVDYIVKAPFEEKGDPW